MTTRVKVELIQQHMPVVVEIMDGKGERVLYHQILEQSGTSAEEYVHSGQTIRVREMTTEEVFNRSTSHA